MKLKSFISPDHLLTSSVFYRRLLILFFLLFVLESCGGYRVKFVNVDQENYLDRDMENMKQNLKELNKEIIELGNLKEIVKEEKKLSGNIEKKLAVINDKVSNLNQNVDQEEVDIAIIQRQIDLDNKIKLELKELLREVEQKTHVNTSYLKEYQDEAISLRGDLIDLKEKTQQNIDQISETLRKSSTDLNRLTALKDNVEGVASSQQTSNVKVNESISKVNEHTKLIGEQSKTINVNTKAIQAIKDFTKQLGEELLKSHKTSLVQIKNLEKRLINVETNDSDIYSRIKNQEVVVDELKSMIDVIKNDKVKVFEKSDVDIIPEDKSEANTLTKVNLEDATKSELMDRLANKLTDSQLYDRANDKYLNKDYFSSVDLFRVFLKNYSESEFRIDALYKLGRSLFEIKDFYGAMEVFDHIIAEENKTGNNMVPTALLRKSMIYVKLGEPAKAELTLKEVIERFPGKPEAQSAKEILAKIAQ